MSEDAAGRIEALIGEVERGADPATRERVRALVGAVLELHAAGLARVSELAGPEVTARLCADPLVESLFLLHGVHPESLEARVHAALGQAAATLEGLGARAELTAIEETAQGPRVRVRVVVRREGEAGRLVEEVLTAAAPDAALAIDEIAESSLVQLSRLAR